MSKEIDNVREKKENEMMLRTERPQATGGGITFVESVRPPMPTSITEASTFSSWKTRNAITVKKRK